MTDDATDWVWTHSRTRGNPRLVMLAVAHKTTDATATARIGTAEMVRSVNAARSTVIAAVDAALATGELEVTNPNAGSRAAEYRIPGAVGYVAAKGPESGPIETARGPESGPLSPVKGPESGPLAESDSPSNGYRSEIRTPSVLGSEIRTLKVDSNGPETGPLSLWEDHPEECDTRTRASSKSIERMSEGAHASGPTFAVAPDFATDLVAKITAAEVYVAWDLTTEEWFRVDALLKRSGTDMLATVAIRAGQKREVSHARYFLRAWQSLPPAPSADVIPLAPRPPLRAVPGGWQPYTNPTDVSAYENGF